MQDYISEIIIIWVINLVGEFALVLVIFDISVGLKLNLKYLKYLEYSN